ncbi:MAG: sulfotransferase family protein [Planctomycetota bacterium]
MAEASPTMDGAKPSSAPPYFLVGAERSGTTLLRLMMDHHPQICCLFESNFFVDYLTDDGGDPDPAWSQQQVALDRAARRAGFEIEDGVPYREGVRAFFEEQLRLSGKPIAGSTIHRRLPDILKVWPDARFVNLIRDPRDVAPSVIKMGWAGDTWHGTRFWVDAQEDMERLRKLVPEGRFVQLRFEDLVSHPVDSLTKICDMLGLPYDEAILSYPNDTTYPAPDASAAARWKKKLSPREIQLVEARAGAWLKRLGYEPSGQPALAVTGMLRRRLVLKTRLAKLRFRIQRFGFGNVM